MRALRIYLMGLLACSFLPSAVRAGDLHIVDGPSGPGFPDIATAVAAASPGDVLLVRGGTYSGFTTNKGISIFPYGDGTVTIQGQVVLEGIAADQSFVISELSISHLVPNEFAFAASFSSGSVRMQLCDVEGSVYVRQCADVAITQSLINGQDCRPGTAIELWSGTLAVFETDAMAGDLCCTSRPDGIRAQREIGSAPVPVLFASGSMFVANQNMGAGFCGCDYCGPGGGRGASLYLPNLPPLIFLDCTLIGGYPGNGGDGQFTCNDCTGPPGAPLSGNGVVLTTEQHRRFSSQTVVPSGESMTLRFAGHAGDVVTLRYSGSGGYTTISDLEGVDLLGPGTQVVNFGTLPAGGVLNTTGTPPALPPGVAADTLFLQATFEKSDGTVLYRTPSAVALVSPCNFPDSPTATYCSAQANSTGQPGVISQSGSTSVAANDLVLLGSSLPSGNNGVFVYSPDMTSTPLGNGTLCVGNQTLGFVLRLPPVTSDGSGVAMHTFDNTTPPDPAGQVFPGETWFFQLWFRDPDAGGAGFNFTDGLSVTFCP